MLIDDYVLSLAQGLHSLPSVVVGDVREISYPHSAEDAPLVIAQMCANFNNAVMRPMVGLDLTALIQSSGQHNSSLITMVLEGLKVCPMASHDFSLDYPLSVVNGEDISFSVLTPTGESVSIGWVREGIETPITSYL